jgi:hypothetical protein
MNRNDWLILAAVALIALYLYRKAMAARARAADIAGHTAVTNQVFGLGTTIVGLFA